MSDTSLPTTPTPSGPYVPQGVQGLIEEAAAKVAATDVLLEALQGNPALDPALVQPVKDARNVIRESTIVREGINRGGGNSNPIP